MIDATRHPHQPTIWCLRLAEGPPVVELWPDYTLRLPDQPDEHLVSYETRWVIDGDRATSYEVVSTYSSLAADTVYLIPTATWEYLNSSRLRADIARTATEGTRTGLTKERPTTATIH